MNGEKQSTTSHLPRLWRSSRSSPFFRCIHLRSLDLAPLAGTTWDFSCSPPVYIFVNIPACFKRYASKNSKDWPLAISSPEPSARTRVCLPSHYQIKLSDSVPRLWLGKPLRVRGAWRERFLARTRVRRHCDTHTHRRFSYRISFWAFRSLTQNLLVSCTPHRSSAVCNLWDKAHERRAERQAHSQRKLKRRLWNWKIVITKSLCKVSFIS